MRGRTARLSGKLAFKKAVACRCAPRALPVVAWGSRRSRPVVLHSTSSTPRKICMSTALRPSCGPRLMTIAVVLTYWSMAATAVPPGWPGTACGAPSTCRRACRRPLSLQHRRPCPKRAAGDRHHASCCSSPARRGSEQLSNGCACPADHADAEFKRHFRHRRDNALHDGPGGSPLPLRFWEG